LIHWALLFGVKGASHAAFWICLGTHLGRAAESAIEDGSERIVETDIERVSERLRIAAA
jgi:hypothetical protein